MADWADVLGASPGVDGGPAMSAECASQATIAARIGLSSADMRASHRRPPRPKLAIHLGNSRAERSTRRTREPTGSHLSKRQTRRVNSPLRDLSLKITKTFEESELKSSTNLRPANRRSSATSDYYSSSQNSPQVKQKLGSSRANLYKNPLYDVSQVDAGKRMTSSRPESRQFAPRREQLKHQSLYQNLEPRTQIAIAYESSDQSSNWRRLAPDRRSDVSLLTQMKVHRKQDECDKANGFGLSQMNVNYNSTNSHSNTQTIGGQLSSLASSQQTNETCDESPNNTDESNRIYNYNTNYQPTSDQNDSSDYHYYQVVVPRESLGQSFSQTGDLRVNLDKHSASPCKSIQRIVSSFLSSNGANIRQPQVQLPPIPTLNQDLVCTEPLIRSSSWQNKTLIDLQRPPGLHHNQESKQIESSLIHKTLPVGAERLHLDQQQLYLNPSTCEQRRLSGANQFEIKYENPTLTSRLHKDEQSLHPLVDFSGRERNLLYSSRVEPRVSPNGFECSPMLSTGNYSVDSPVGKTSAAGKTLGPLLLLGLLGLLLLSVVSVLGILLIGHPTPSSSRLWPETANKQQTKATREPSEPSVAISTNDFGLTRYPDPQMGATNSVPMAVSPKGRTPPGGLALWPQIVPTTNSPMTVRPPTKIVITEESSKKKKLADNYAILSQPSWRIDDRDEQSNCPLGCGSQGRCDSTATCSCFPGFSGPRCSIENCPNECSQRGECRIVSSGDVSWPNSEDAMESERAYRPESTGFWSLSGSLALNSQCPAPNSGSQSDSGEKLRKSGGTYDNRIRWACHCESGFTGVDCSQVKETQCDNERDDDDDGLVDCEDEDCCSQSVCRDDLMCFKSPEPNKVLQQKRPSDSWSAQFWSEGQSSRRPKSADRIANQLRFLIANDSVQSYAQEKAFDWARVAVIRGKVIKFRAKQDQDDTQLKDHTGVVGVRVSVVEKAQFGFTLTRSDGQFDLLVNGNEWITLQFHRNAYAPLKRRVYVRAHSLQSLDSPFEMWLANQHQPPDGDSRTDLPFGLQLSGELSKLANQLSRGDESRRVSILECMLRSRRQIQGPSDIRFVSLHQPKIVTPNHQDQQELLNTFALVTSDAAFRTQLDSSLGPKMQLIYNSGSSPATSAVKPTVSIRLTSQRIDQIWGQHRHELSKVILQLDIEGQSRRDQLTPMPGLVYVFSWDRRNVYRQKVYGFAELRIRVGYEYQIDSQQNNTTMDSIFNCLEATQEDSVESEARDRLTQISATLQRPKRTVWFEARVHLEANQLNQQADAGKWSLSATNRLDSDREVIYFGAGWSLPLALVYPPLVSSAIQIHGTQMASELAPATSSKPTGRLMTKGPNSTMFVIVLSASRSASRLVQVDSTAKRKIIDVPLSILASKFPHWQMQSDGELDTAKSDLELVYNNFLSTLYLSSRSAARIVQINLASLVVLNRTLSGDSPTAAAEDEIDIEPLCGFGHHLLSSASESQMLRAGKSAKLLGPHSLTLDEDRQILYCVDGATNLMALDLTTNQVILLPTFKKKADTSRVGGPCNSMHSSPEIDYKPSEVHSLTWSRADSSLYFVDSNILFALRSDLSLEVIVAGATDRNSNSPVACLVNRRLGLIKTLAMDELASDLLIGHQLSDDPSKSGGIYLAKIKLGLTHLVKSNSTHVLDLHSASWTWIPLIMSIAGHHLADWPKSNDLQSASVSPSEFVRLPNLSLDSGTRHERSSKNVTPLIDLSAGFDRIDSLEFNSDGSIFVLNSRTNSLRIISAYSSENLEQVERSDVSINRIFAKPVKGEDRNQKLHVLIARNPLTGELMEFHSSTGLHLSSTFDDGLKLQYYYQIISTVDSSDSKVSELDENDKDDFKIRQFLSDYLSDANSKSSVLESKYMRLSQVSDSLGNIYEFERSFDGQNGALKSLSINKALVSEMTNDQLGFLRTFVPVLGDTLTEFVYDSNTLLLRNIISKTKENTLTQTNTYLAANDSTKRSGKISSSHRRVKRIAYDKIFNQYCDLYEADM